MDQKECFHILSLSPGATLDEAKKAYKALVKRWHPDQFGGDSGKQAVAQERLKEINVAYREVVGRLKHSSPRVPGTTVQKAAAPPVVEKAPATIFQRLSALFRQRKQPPAHGTTSINNRRGGGRITRPAAPHCGARPPEFKKALRNALRNHPRPEGGGQRMGRAGGRRCGQGMGRGAAFRPPGACRQGPTDRIEEIRPVERIKKI